MSRVLLLGATGGIGRRVLPRLLVAGHHVTTLSRRADAFAAGPATRPMVGDVTDPAAVAAAVDGQDVVISALGVATLKPDDTLARGTENVLGAMNGHGVDRLIAVTGNGLGVNGGFVVDKIVTPLLLKNVKADAEAQEASIRRSTPHWTIIRPFRLVDRWPSLRYQVADTFSRTLIARWTTREDVARCVVDQVHDVASRQILWVASGGR